jgi:hypothetical protein
MKVFISWSGPQSKYIACALRKWLSLVIQHIEPWMSELDVGAGQRWVNELWKELQNSHFGVVCVTAENLQAPWMLFETGALAKAVEQRVCPYLYEIQPQSVQGPLTHFQMKKTDKTGTKELLQGINDASRSLGERALPIERLNEAFENWWPNLEEMPKTIPTTTIPAPPPRKTEDMLEELLGLVRNLARSSLSRDDLFELVLNKVRNSSLRGTHRLETLVRQRMGNASSHYSMAGGRVTISEPIPTPPEPQEGTPSPN